MKIVCVCVCVCALIHDIVYADLSTISPYAAVQASCVQQPHTDVGVQMCVHYSTCRIVFDVFVLLTLNRSMTLLFCRSVVRWTFQRGSLISIWSKFIVLTSNTFVHCT